jgi:hypothetical protein
VEMGVMANPLPGGRVVVGVVAVVAFLFSGGYLISGSEAEDSL